MDGLPKEEVIYLLFDECPQPKKFPIYSMQHSFQEVSFPGKAELKVVRMESFVNPTWDLLNQKVLTVGEQIFDQSLSSL